MRRCGAGVIRSPTKLAPISPDNPMPRIVSANPVATWLTASPSVISAKISDEQRAGEDAAKGADRDRAGVQRAAEAAGGADDHHAFDPEIEHARALGHEFAGGRDQQRRRCGQHRKDDGLKQFHGTPFGARAISRKR